MKEKFKMPEGETVHAMSVIGDHLFIADGNKVYSYYVPPKTIWLHIKDFFITGKSWLD